MPFLFLLLAQLTIGHAEPKFDWCHPVSSYTLEELASATIPSYPDYYAKEATFENDGVWVFDLPLEAVWDIYSKTPLKQIWKSTRLPYDFATIPSSPRPIDLTTAPGWPGLQVGLRFYLDILGPVIESFCKLGMGVEFTEVVPNKYFKFEYLDFSPAYGEQWVQFTALSPQKTAVSHSTRYLGKDKVIDWWYMSFHREAIASLHAAAQEMARLPAQP